MVTRQRIVLGVLVGVGLAAAVYLASPGREPGPARTTSAGPRGAAAGERTVPRIGLDRLTQLPPEAALGGRDIFDFGAPPPTPVPPPTPPPDVAAGPPPTIVPTPTPLPPLNVKYIGSLENQQGLKVAVLLTDRKEVLTGQTGEVVANRYRIVKIGVESLDLQEVGSDRVRRIPLRGN